MPRIAIQTPLYRSSQYLPMLLKSLRAQTFTDWVFYACENSGDVNEQTKVKDLLAESGLPHEFFINERNLGFADGHNFLLQKHRADFILLLNEDAYLDPEHLARCVQRFEADAHCAAVAGAVYRWTAPVDQEEVLTDETFVDTLALRYNCLAHVVDIGAGAPKGEMSDFLDAAKVVWGVSGAVSMFRRVHVEAASPERLMFYPGFFMYKEDVDLAIRLFRKGYTTWFDPSIVSFHRRSIKAPSGIKARIEDERKRPAHLRQAMYRNQWWIYANHFSWSLGFSDIIRSIIHECIHSVFVFVVSPSVFFGAWKEICRGWSLACQRRSALERLGLLHKRLLP